MSCVVNLNFISKKTNNIETFFDNVKCEIEVQGVRQFFSVFFCYFVSQNSQGANFRPQFFQLFSLNNIKTPNDICISDEFWLTKLQKKLRQRQNWMTP